MRKRPLYDAEFRGRGNAKSWKPQSKGSEAREGRAVDTFRIYFSGLVDVCAAGVTFQYL